MQSPTSLTFEQQKDVLDRTFDLITKFNNGIPPKGSVAPCWDISKEGTALLLDKGIEYGQFSVFTFFLSLTHTLADHSHMAHEYASHPVNDAGNLSNHFCAIALKHITYATKINGRKSTIVPKPRHG